MQKPVLLSVNCYNRFQNGYFRRWWEHMEAMVVQPYQDLVDTFIYDDGSTDAGMREYLSHLKDTSRVNTLTLAEHQNHLYPLARHAFGNVGYSSSLRKQTNHRFILHFDTDIWFIHPQADKGFDWLTALMSRLDANPSTFAGSLWGCLWSNGASYRDDDPPSWFKLGEADPPWLSSWFFSTRMFLARNGELEQVNQASLTAIGRRGRTRGNRRGLIGKLDSYERIANDIEIYGKHRPVAVLGAESGVITRHLHSQRDLRWADVRLGIRTETTIRRSS